MFTKLTEQNGCAIAEFTDVKRFTLAIIEDVKAELKPTLSIEFIDSSGIGCIISLIKTAKSHNSGIKLCNLSKEVKGIFELLHLQMILDIEQDVESAIKKFN